MCNIAMVCIYTVEFYCCNVCLGVIVDPIGQYDLPSSVCVYVCVVCRVSAHAYVHACMRVCVCVSVHVRAYMCACSFIFLYCELILLTDSFLERFPYCLPSMFSALLSVTGVIAVGCLLPPKPKDKQ